MYEPREDSFLLLKQIKEFAHGAVLAIGSYFLYTFAVTSGMNFWLAAVLALLVSCVAGMSMNWLVYRPLRKRKASSAVLLIASIALMILVNALLLAIWGASVKTIKTTNPVFDFFDARITLIQISIILTSLVLLCFLWWLMKKTTLGKAMRAVADNKEVAQTVGINPEMIYTKTFAIGSLLAGVAGILIGIEQTLCSNAESLGGLFIRISYACDVQKWEIKSIE